MNQKNEEIVKYVVKKIDAINEEYPNSISDEKKQIAIDLFINRNEPLPIIFKEIDTMAENTIKNRQQRDANDKDPSHKEGHSFSEIQKALDVVKESTKFASSKLYISGGTVPYLLLGQDSNRNHSDIDNIVDLKDISEFREIFVSIKTS